MAHSCDASRQPRPQSVPMAHIKTQERKVDGLTIRFAESTGQANETAQKSWLGCCVQTACFSHNDQSVAQPPRRSVVPRLCLRGALGGVISRSGWLEERGTSFEFGR